MDIKNEAIKKSKLEVANVPPIVAIFRQAMRTFDDKIKADSPEFKENFEKLKSLVDKITPEDLGFDKNLADLKFWAKPRKAPCTYIEVIQNDKINMSIFVLKPGFTMPLHDHPQMHGLLKVIYGAVDIRSFTEYPLTEVVDMVDIEMRAKLEADRLSHGVHKHRKLYATISDSENCREDSGACILTPTLSNYHEIRSKVPSAFFDILAPPYDTFSEELGPRRCKYYQVLQELTVNVVELEEIPVPECFYCDQAPYLGPPIP
ncbi:2-aminoethanethiol dioxygenase [Eumeta japonica]|uniref:2-aminoethanethiol dioxygenase n=1 Tax=Eumeta variegata TaxID=151549 RepID=A0A4C1WVF6_EUMVA|nr:2-aminoethanethiol dioxygenase [Eumeta japonica]